MLEKGRDISVYYYNPPPFTLWRLKKKDETIENATKSAHWQPQNGALRISSLLSESKRSRTANAPHGTA